MRRDRRVTRRQRWRGWTQGTGVARRQDDVIRGRGGARPEAYRLVTGAGCGVE